jgi:hypothetical protein
MAASVVHHEHLVCGADIVDLLQDLELGGVMGQRCAPPVVGS